MVLSGSKARECAPTCGFVHQTDGKQLNAIVTLSHVMTDESYHSQHGVAILAESVQARASTGRTLVSLRRMIHGGGRMPV